METTTTKYWNRGKFPEGAVYVTSYDVDETPTDVYRLPDGSGWVVWGNETEYGAVSPCNIKGTEWIEVAKNILAAKSRPQPPATMGLSREELIEKATKAIMQSWDKCDYGDLRRHATFVVDALFPELKPAPVPEKTAGQRIVELNDKNEAAKAIDAALADLRERCIKALDAEGWALPQAVIRSVPLTVEDAK